jgi:hypothetical protein
MAAVWPAVYIIFMAFISSLALLYGPSLIEAIRGPGYRPPCERTSDGVEMKGIDDSNSSGGSRGNGNIDNSSSPLVMSCFSSGNV